jgi:hypothetical protein
MVSVIDAPDDETVAKHVLTVGAGGNVRTITLKAFPEETYRSIIAGLPRPWQAARFATDPLRLLRATSKRLARRASGSPRMEMSTPHGIGVPIMGQSGSFRRLERGPLCATNGHRYLPESTFANR